MPDGETRKSSNFLLRSYLSWSSYLREPVQQVVKGEVIKLSVQRKHLTDLIKMVAYQAECDLLDGYPDRRSRTFLLPRHDAVRQLADALG